nr:MAG: hypothetical protein 3 [Leviviridae sp.]
MKSQVTCMFHVVEGVLMDVQRAYPTLKGVDLDLERLSLLLEKRGIGVLTLDLPARGTALVRALETGFLDASGTKRYSKRYAVPRLFAGLYMKIFDCNLCLRDDFDVNALMFLRQLLELGKKLEIPCSRRRTSNAIKEYIHVESTITPPTYFWGRDSLGHIGGAYRVHLCDPVGSDLPLFPESSGDREIIRLLNRCQRIADTISRSLGTFCPDCVIDESRAKGISLGLRHGPGAVAEHSGRFYDKFRFSNWSPKLEHFYPFSSWGRMPNDVDHKVLRHEAPSRLICVPKTAKSPRIIAAEPSEHMFTQNLFASWLTEKFRTTPIGAFLDLRDQRKSGELVLSASLNRELATIDLSSASDRLSLWVVERIFRSNPSILHAIHATRTRWLRLPNGECLELKKFASQGTALTFPVQSLVFLVIALACSGEGNPDDINSMLRLRNRVRVYGDDIIIPVHRYAATTSLLTRMGLKVNDEKSFHLGSFRESCGVDAYKGYDVTPCKPKTFVADSSASSVAVLDQINNLFYKGYWNASEQLRNRQRSRCLNDIGIVGVDAGATGFASYSFETLLAGYLERDTRGHTEIYNALRDGIRHPVGMGELPRNVAALLRPGGRYPFLLRAFRLRMCRSKHRLEVRIATFSSFAKYRAFDCGYSGVFLRQILPGKPSATKADGIRGIPERPGHQKVTRWVELRSLSGGF